MKTQKNPLIYNLSAEGGSASGRKPLTLLSERSSKMKPQNNPLTYHLTPLTLLFERSKKMKRKLLLLAVMIMATLFFTSQSWAECDATHPGVDLGICDTIYVETFDCDHTYEATGAYDSVRVAIYVTHDSNTFLAWPGTPDEKWVQDSISGFVIPLNFTLVGCADSLIFPTTPPYPTSGPFAYWNNKIMNPGNSRFPRSVFRHLYNPHTGVTDSNRLALMHDAGFPDWTVNFDVVNKAPGHFFMNVIPMASDCERWWEGSRVLLGTMTFLLYGLHHPECDSSAICLDSTHWQPGDYNVTFVRYDAKGYVPRHFLPVCDTESIVPCSPPNITCPSNESQHANGTYTTTTTWTANAGGGPGIVLTGVTAATTAPGLTNPIVSYDSPPPAATLSGKITYTVASHCSTGGAITLTATNTCSPPLTAQCSFNVTLTNDPPVANCPSNATFAYNVGYSGTATATDPDGDAVTFFKVAGPAGLNVTSNGNITWPTGCSDVGGPYTVTVRATDVCGATNDCSFQLTVTNAPPIITCPPNDTTWVGLFISGNFTENDPEGGPVTVSFVSITPPATNNPTIVGNHVEWYASLSDPPGMFTIRLRVTDECGLTGECTFTVLVKPTFNCSQEPNDLGKCDTLHVEPFNGDQTYEGTEGYDSVRVALYVTHDSNTIPSGPYQGVQDSISGFVIPLKFWTQGCVDSVVFPTYDHWNNKRFDPTNPQFNRSMFRHLVDPETGDTTYNRFALMNAEGLDDWTCNLDVVSHDSGHVFLSLIRIAPNSQAWPEGSRELLATLTFLVYMPDTCESTAICLDSTFWPPANHLYFVRYDAICFTPRVYPEMPTKVPLETERPEAVYVFDRPLSGQNLTNDDKADNKREGTIWDELGLLNQDKEPGKVNWDKCEPQPKQKRVCPIEDAGVCLGYAITGAQSKIISRLRSLDGKKEAWNVNEPPPSHDNTIREAFNRPHAPKDGNAKFIWRKQGLEYVDKVTGQRRQGGGLRGDNEREYAGVCGGGTRAPYKDGVYPLQRADGSKVDIQFDVDYSDSNPGGNNTISVVKSAEQCPAVGSVIGKIKGKLEVGLQITFPNNTEDEAEAAWRKLFNAPEMKKAGFKKEGIIPPAEQKEAVKAWIGSLPFDEQYQTVKQIIQGLNAHTATFNYTLTEKKPKGDTCYGDCYDHCPILFTPEFACTTEYLPDSSRAFDARLIVPAGAISAPTMFHIRQLGRLTETIPSGLNLESGVFDFRDVAEEYELVNPIFITLTYFGNPDSLVMFRFDDSLGSWVPAGESSFVDTVNQTLTIHTRTIGAFAVFSPFMRGDATRDGVIDISDVVYLINYLFIGGPAPVPLWVGDANSDEVVDVSDVVYLINYLFVGGPAPCEDKGTPSPSNGLELNKGKAPAQIGFSSPTISKDGIFNLPVIGKFDVDLAAVQLEIKYDPKKITLLEPALTPKTEGLSIYSSSNQGIQKIDSLRSLQVGILDPTGKHQISAGTNALVNLKIKGSDLTSRFASLTTGLEITKAILVDKNAQKIPVQIVAKMKESGEELVGEKSAIPQEFSLSQNYPNPFNPETEISYGLPRDCYVKLAIHNVAGQKVNTLVDERQSAGYKTIYWNGRDDKGKEVASGIYFYKLEAGNFTESRKMVLIK